MDAVIQIVVLTAIIVFLIGIVWTQNVFADSFQDFPIRLKHSPVLCAMEPQPDPQFQGVGRELLDKTNYAVMDWNNKLNQGYGKHPAWNLTLIQVPLSKQATFDSSQCDITIDYYRIPSTPQLEFVATGLTIPNFEEGKTRIEIYYQGIIVYAKYTQWTVGGITYYTYIPIPSYSGSLAGDAQLDGAIRHEIGHSLGLGHYIVTNSELDRIVHGQEDMPSIMIPIETALGVTNFDITPLDIAEIKSIYGLNGMGSQTPLNQYNKVSLIQTDKFDYSPQDMVKIKVDISNFDDNEYAQLMALDPSNKMMDTFTVSKSNSTFTFNNENQTGTYYMELIDPYKDLYDFTGFIVSSQNIPSFDLSTQQLTKSSTIPSTSKPVQYPLVNLPPQDNNAECFNVQSGDHPYSTGQSSELVYSEGQPIVICGYVGVDGKTTIYTYDQSINQIESFTVYSPNSKYFSVTLDPNKYNHAGKYLLTIDYGGGHLDYSAGFTIIQNNTKSIPNWVKNTAKWWSQGQVGNSDFIKGIQYLVQNGILQIPQTQSNSISTQSQQIPQWIKNNAGWWANDEISDDEFIKALQYLVEEGIINVEK